MQAYRVYCAERLVNSMTCPMHGIVPVQVDSVGSSVLFMRPYVFQQGATFGVANLVGADWEREVSSPHPASF